MLKVARVSEGWLMHAGGWVQPRAAQKVGRKGQTGKPTCCCTASHPPANLSRAARSQRPAGGLGGRAGAGSATVGGHARLGGGASLSTRSTPSLQALTCRLLHRRLASPSRFCRRDSAQQQERGRSRRRQAAGRPHPRSGGRQRRRRRPLHWLRACRGCDDRRVASSLHGWWRETVVKASWAGRCVVGGGSEPCCAIAPDDRSESESERE